MNNICRQCGGKCCQGIIDVYSTDDIFYDDTLVCEDDEDIGGYDRIMQTDKNQKCIALKNGKCSIYDKRPQVCRMFEVGSSCCENFRNGSLNAHKCGFCVVSDALQKAGIK